MEKNLLTWNQSKGNGKDSRLKQSFTKSVENIEAETHCFSAVLGAGVGLGSEIGCDIEKFFSSCTEFFKSEKENIRKGIQRIQEIQNGFQQLTTSSNEKILAVGKQLNSLNAMEKRLPELQRFNSQKLKRKPIKSKKNSKISPVVFDFCNCGGGKLTVQ